MFEQAARAFDVDPGQLGFIRNSARDGGGAVNDGIERTRRQKTLPRPQDPSVRFALSRARRDVRPPPVAQERRHRCRRAPSWSRDGRRQSRRRLRSAVSQRVPSRTRPPHRIAFMAAAFHRGECRGGSQDAEVLAPPSVAACRICSPSRAPPPARLRRAFVAVRVPHRPRRLLGCVRRKSRGVGQRRRLATNQKSPRCRIATAPAQSPNDDHGRVSARAPRRQVAAKCVEANDLRRGVAVSVVARHKQGPPVQRATSPNPASFCKRRA